MSAVDLTSTPFRAGSTVRYTCVLRDEDQVLLPASAFATLRLTITNPYSGAVVNGADAVDVLNSGRGVLDESGNLEILLGPGDTAKQTSLTLERRRLALTWVYGASTGEHVVDIGLTED